MNGRALAVVLSTVVLGGALVAALGVLATDAEPDRSAPSDATRVAGGSGIGDASAGDSAAAAAPNEPGEARPEKGSRSGNADESGPESVREVEADRERTRVDPARTWREGLALASDAAAWSRSTFAARSAAARGVQHQHPEMEFREQRTYESGGQRRHVVVFHHERTQLEFVLVPGGTFSMGSPESEPGRHAQETLHPVTVGPFLIARTEVTQAAWKQLFDHVPSRWKGDDLPVEGVSNAEAEQYCRRVGLSLPTEAEWEYACRGGTRTPWSFGDDAAETDAHAWHVGNAGSRTHPVAQKLPNALGLHDVHGNVWEWCSDWHGPYAKEHQSDPVGPERGTHYIIRGGSWYDPPRNVRSAVRSRYQKPEPNIGFRPVLRLD